MATEEELEAAQQSTGDPAEDAGWMDIMGEMFMDNLGGPLGGMAVDQAQNYFNDPAVQSPYGANYQPQTNMPAPPTPPSMPPTAPRPIPQTPLSSPRDRRLRERAQQLGEQGLPLSRIGETEREQRIEQEGYAYGRRIYEQGMGSQFDLGGGGVPTTQGGAGQLIAQLVPYLVRLVGQNPEIWRTIRDAVSLRVSGDRQGQGMNPKCASIIVKQLPKAKREAVEQWLCGFQTPIQLTKDGDETFAAIHIASLGVLPSGCGCND